jgi:hypothetical protein
MSKLKPMKIGDRVLRSNKGGGRYYLNHFPQETHGVIVDYNDILEQYSVKWGKQRYARSYYREALKYDKEWVPMKLEDFI